MRFTAAATALIMLVSACQPIAEPSPLDTTPPLPPAPPVPPADGLGAIEVLTLTAGDDADPDGYQVTVAGQTQISATVGSVQFSGLTPGPYDVVVDGLTANCATTDGMTTQSVTLSEGGVTVALQFNILCQSVTPPDPSPPPSINAPACYLNGTGCSEVELQVWEEAEKDRIAAEQQASQPVYDSLKVEWDTYLHSFPQGQSQFLMCDPLQYTGDVKIVGPEGADMSIGPHKLRIPAGALTDPVVITGVMPVSLLVSVELSPHGLQFAPGVTLELNYGHCDQPEAYQHRVAYLDGNGNVLEWPTSIDYSAYDEITADIDHFSTYAVAY